MPLILDGTNGETFPSWTTATRPASPSAGQTGFNTTTGQLETYNGSGWRISTAASTQGTSGQYLQSAGAGAAPTWATLSSSGSLIRAPQILTSGTSYTTPSNCTAIYVEAVGGGGGGGGKDNVANDIGGSGGSGAYCAKYFTVTSSTAYTYAIGAAGTGGAAGVAGVAGGDTTFTVGATTITANGGNAGAAGTSTAQKITVPTGGVNGDINVNGNYGISFSGGQRAGGSSVFGGGRVSTEATVTTPAAASNYGGGGAGAFQTNTNNVTGGAGSQGVIRVWEYT